MESVLLDAAGHHRSPATMPGITDAAAETCFGLDVLLPQLLSGKSAAAKGELLLVVRPRSPVAGA